MPQRAQDIAKAKQLLQTAGMTSVNVTLTTEQFLEIPQYAQYVKQMAAPAGFNITLTSSRRQVLRHRRDNQPWLQAPRRHHRLGARGVPPDIDPYSPAPKPDLSTAPWNSRALV